jgi:hypothetical protein
MGGGRPCLFKLVCVAVSATHASTIPTARAMKMPSWLKKTKNNAEAISSSSVHHGHRPPSPPPAVLLRQLPLAPRSEDYLTLLVHVVAPPRRQRNRRYMPLEECE